MAINWLKSTADFFVCECGNSPDTSGYYSCRPSGEICEPDFDWDGYSYLCVGCNRIYDIEEMREIGTAHPSAIHKNKTKQL